MLDRPGQGNPLRRQFQTAKLTLTYRNKQAFLEWLLMIRGLNWKVRAVGLTIIFVIAIAIDAWYLVFGMSFGFALSAVAYSVKFVHRRITQ